MNAQQARIEAKLAALEDGIAVDVVTQIALIAEGVDLRVLD